MDMNVCQFVGRLAEDVKFTPASGKTAAKATGRLIVNRPHGQDGTQKYDTIPLVAWGVHAENLAKYTSKGKELGIVGSMRTNFVRNPDGSTRNFFECMIKEMSFGRDSTAAKVAKATEVAEVGPRPDAVAEALDALLKSPGIAEHLRNVRNSARPEQVLAPVRREKVLDAPSLEISDWASAGAENPFND